MYCPYCGTQIPDDASFCSKCGKPQSVTRPTSEKQVARQIEWEYWTWKAGVPTGMHIGSISKESRDRSGRVPEPYVRLQFWQQIQSRVLPVIQKLSDDGWEPITEIGPSAIVIENSKVKEGNLGDFFKELALVLIDPGWKCYGVKIEFRRQKGVGKYSTNELDDFISRAGY